MSDPLISVMIADADSTFRLGMRTLIASTPGLQLIAEAADGDQALSLVQEGKPDVLLLNIQLPRLNGIEVLKRLSALGVETKPILLTASIERGQLRAALTQGARGVLLKDRATALLAKCVKQVMHGEYWVGRDDVGHLVEALRNPTWRVENAAGGLTVREKEITQLVVTGAGNKDIAWQLGLTEQTIKNNLRKIFEKLHVGNRVELAMMAMNLHLPTRSAPAASDKGKGSVSK